ncbi:MAG TPA: hypothetical protein VFV50_07625 [Bdellovibrionales bacterium]|nr:hypothetical protein [Bdellovibrionales bacterium]
MRLLSALFVLFMSLGAQANAPTAMGLALRYQADYACEPRGVRAEGVYVLMWRRPRAGGYNVELRTKDGVQRLVFDNIYREWNTRTRFNSRENLYPMLYIDENQFSHHARVTGPNGTKFIRWANADISLDGRPWPKSYNLTCYSPRE